MLYTITDGSFTAKIDSLGAQLVSLTGPDGFEYIWVGDKAYWGGHAPVLFPIVGALREGKTQIGGKWYHMGRHGFARTSEFTAEEEPAGSSAKPIRSIYGLFCSVYLTIYMVKLYYVLKISQYIVKLAISVHGCQQLGKSLVGSAVKLNCLYKERLLNL